MNARFAVQAFRPGHVRAGCGWKLILLAGGPIRRDQAHRALGEGGFHTEDAAFEALREEYLEPDTISPDDARWIGAEVSRVFAAKREEEEAGWPPVTDFDRLSRAFDELEASGILALHCPGNTWSDGVSEA